MPKHGLGRGRGNGVRQRQRYTIYWKLFFGGCTRVSIMYAMSERHQESRGIERRVHNHVRYIVAMSTG